jgi:hypothetical protein
VTEHAKLTEQFSEVAAITDKIRPLLAGVDAAVAGAVLADLTATLLAGHIYFDDAGIIGRAETDQLREDLLTGHVDAVRALIPINEAIIIDRS